MNPGARLFVDDQ